MRVTIERNDGTVRVSASEPVSHDVLGMIGASDLVKARMRYARCATFEVVVRRFECMCSKLGIKCRCKPSASIVEVGERVA
jgi:hypothetical protein